jgi:hypothetical protein
VAADAAHALTAIALTLAVSGCAVGLDDVNPLFAFPFKWSSVDRSASMADESDEGGAGEQPL